MKKLGPPQPGTSRELTVREAIAVGPCPEDISHHRPRPRPYTQNLKYKGLALEQRGVSMFWECEQVTRESASGLRRLQHFWEGTAETVHLSIRVPPSQVEWLREAAQDQGTDLSTRLRGLIGDAIALHEGQQ